MTRPAATLLAKTFEIDNDPILYLVIGGSRDGDAAGIGKRLQAIGDVHTVTMDILTLDDDVAEVDAAMAPG